MDFDSGTFGVIGVSQFVSLLPKRLDLFVERFHCGLTEFLAIGLVAIPAATRPYRLDVPTRRAWHGAKDIGLTSLERFDSVFLEDHGFEVALDVGVVLEHVALLAPAHLEANDFWVPSLGDFPTGGLVSEDVAGGVFDACSLAATSDDLAKRAASDWFSVVSVADAWEEGCFWVAGCGVFLEPGFEDFLSCNHGDEDVASTGFEVLGFFSEPNPVLASEVEHVLELDACGFATTVSGLGEEDQECLVTEVRGCINEGPELIECEDLLLDLFSYLGFSGEWESVEEFGVAPEDSGPSDVLSNVDTPLVSSAGSKGFAFEPLLGEVLPLGSAMILDELHHVTSREASKWSFTEELAEGNDDSELSLHGANLDSLFLFIEVLEGVGTNLLVGNRLDALTEAIQ